MRLPVHLSLCASVLSLQVNAAGNVLLDTFVAQKEAVADFRTWVSGVTPQHLMGAPGIEEVQKQVGAGVSSVCEVEEGALVPLLPGDRNTPCCLLLFELLVDCHHGSVQFEVGVLLAVSHLL